MGLVILVIYALFVLPKVAHWFFARVGGDRSLRLVFGIAAFLSGAVLAEMASIDGIVGAFLAGLGLNRVIPERSPLMEQVQFVGSALFIPIFLVSVGVLLEPKVLIDPKTLLIAAVFTVAVLGGKALAAVVAGRTFGFSWAEIGVMSGLSGSQAAATLATTLVGARLGIFDKTTINAVLVVILVTLVITPAMVSYFGKKVSREEGAGEALGSAILVPVWGESTRRLLGHGGKARGARWRHRHCRQSRDRARAGVRAQAPSATSRTRLRSGLPRRGSNRGLSSGYRARFRRGYSKRPAARAQRCFSPNGSAVRPTRSTPAVRHSVPCVARTSPLFSRMATFIRAIASWSSVARDDFTESRRPNIELAVELATRLEHNHRFAFVGLRSLPLESIFAAQTAVDRIDSNDPIAWVKESAGESDLLIFSGLDAAREALARSPDLMTKRFLVVIAPTPAARQPHPEASDALVAGRSLAEGPAR